MDGALASPLLFYHWVSVSTPQCVGRRVGGSEASIVSRSGAPYGADLGTSSNHSNEVLRSPRRASLALKAVVEKVSLRLANKQGLVGPKPQGKPLLTGKREAG